MNTTRKPGVIRNPNTLTQLPQLPPAEDVKLSAWWAKVVRWWFEVRTVLQRKFDFIDATVGNADESDNFVASYEEGLGS